MSTVRSVPGESSHISMKSALRSARILIVDDEAIVRDILKRRLIDLGCACESCDNFRDARDLLAKRRYDLLLADVSLPGESGRTILKEALRICPNIAVILLTSVVDIETAVDSLKDGATTT